MSVIYKGVLVESDMTRNALGGTEMMRNRLLACVDKRLLENVAIHFSRPGEIDGSVVNVLYCHDLAADTAVEFLADGHESFACFVFVSYWQRDQYIDFFGLPHSKCVVIPNAIETRYDPTIVKQTETIRFIYHTTPHRGLELVYPIFSKLAEIHDKIHLDVYSSFAVYGWDHRNQPYQPLFDAIARHPNMTYHGGVSNDTVIDALRQSHVFLYPSIWQETSCIALIEAMTTGCLAIYPSYGALPETGSLTNNVGMYPHTENVADSATRAFSIATWLISSERQQPGYLRKLHAQSINDKTAKHHISSYKASWETLLRNLASAKQ
jgi:UDP-glucose:(glucosyl)LPS alpha-1,2-glucosyltransferase